MNYSNPPSAGITESACSGIPIKIGTAPVTLRVLTPSKNLKGGPYDMKLHCRGDAMLVVGCSKAVSGLCYPDMKRCTFVDGPANTIINYVSEVPVSANMFYHIQVSWEVSSS